MTHHMPGHRVDVETWGNVVRVVGRGAGIDWLPSREFDLRAMTPWRGNRMPRIEIADLSVTPTRQRDEGLRVIGDWNWQEGKGDTIRNVEYVTSGSEWHHKALHMVGRFRPEISNVFMVGDKTGFNGRGYDFEDCVGGTVRGGETQHFNRDITTRGKTEGIKFIGHDAIACNYGWRMDSQSYPQVGCQFIGGHMACRVRGWRAEGAHQVHAVAATIYRHSTANPNAIWVGAHMLGGAHHVVAHNVGVDVATRDGDHFVVTNGATHSTIVGNTAPTMQLGFWEQDTGVTHNKWEANVGSFRKGP